jgi:hypothetical protein
MFREVAAPVSKVIKAQHFIRDLRSGMTDIQLMAKYVVSDSGLQKVYNKLLDARAISLEELAGRLLSTSPGPPGGTEADRLALRHDVGFVLPVYNASDPETLGLVRNITEAGLGTQGLGVRLNESAQLVIPADEFFDMERLLFTAECRWVQSEGPDAEYLAGFEITSISKTDYENMRKLIGMVRAVNDIEEAEYTDAQYLPVTEARIAPRYCQDMALPIHDASKPNNRGEVVDLGETGIGTRGLIAAEGDTKTLVIPAYLAGKKKLSQSIVVLAECRWSRKTDEGYTAGFKIVHRTIKNYNELKRLIKGCEETSPGDALPSAS